MNPITQRLIGSGLGWSMRLMAGRFLKEADQAERVSRRTLQEILALNGSTEWGRSHGLNGPHAERAFADHPITTYKDYAPYIERMANGEQNLLTREPVDYFSVTSGTTGPQKLIPVTRRQMKTIMKNMLVPMGLAMRSGLLGPMKGRWLQIMTEQINGRTPGGIPKGAATSGGLQQMGRMTELFWTSPLPVLQVQEQEAARYLHLRFALGEERLWAIVAIFPSTLLFTLRDLNQRAPELLRDLADGTITPDLPLASAVRADLQTRLRPNKTRARQLATLLERGQFTVRDIWPEVGTVMTAASGTFRFYADQLQPHLGGVPLFSPIYGASEAAIGVGLTPDRPGYVISPSSAYCEFLPVEDGDRPDARPVPPNQLEPGAAYELVLTNFAGLTRYRLGDVVRALGYQGQAPFVEFVERRGQVINIVGEKTGESQVARAFETACRTQGAQVIDYVVTPDPYRTPARYLLLVEGLTEGLPVERLRSAFEQELCRTAPDYADSVRMGELAPLEALELRSGAFERYRQLRVAAGASAVQVKVPHVAPDPQFVTHYFQGEVSL